MNKVAHVLLAISLNIFQDITCIEYLNEQAWLDTRGRDSFFDYTALAEPNRYYYNNINDQNTYSNNVDSELFFVSIYFLKILSFVLKIKF